MRKRLTRVEPFSAGVIGGATGLILGLLNGVGSALFFSAFRQNMVTLGLAQQASLLDEFSKAFPFMFGWPALILSPIGWAAAGFGSGLVGAWFYNQLAGRLGGIEVEFQDGTP